MKGSGIFRAIASMMSGVVGNGATPEVKTVFISKGLVRRNGMKDFAVAGFLSGYRSRKPRYIGDRSRYKPHQGDKECARRREQMGILLPGETRRVA